MNTYDALMAYVRETSLLGTTIQLLRWDQETMLPPGGVEHRGRQVAQLAGMVHERATSPRLGELLDACEQDPRFVADPWSDSAVNVRELRHDYDRATRIPAALVKERAETRTLAQRAWVEARQRSDFSLFQPFLEKHVTLARSSAECFGWPADGEAWDALADDYERDMTAAAVDALFVPLRERLQALIAAFASVRHEPGAFAQVRLPIAVQQAFVRRVAERMGFDFARGRLDVSAHPFCSGQHPGDVRMTTRYSEAEFGAALAAVMHETGHALYNQGLSLEHSGTPLGRAVSHGIHESQSLMWENQVGRSEAFWRWCLGELEAVAGEPVSHLSLEDVYRDVNRVMPSLIRVDADEATYNLHIMVRFELERALLAGALDAADVPHEWNVRYREYLGVDVPDDRSGCLQDIHWSMGAFGYFPSYTLGSLYAAQIFETALADMPGLYDAFAEGDFSPLRRWLNRKVHGHGSRYRAGELCERITGRPLSPEALVRHLEGKLRAQQGV